MEDSSKIGRRGSSWKSDEARDLIAFSTPDAGSDDLFTQEPHPENYVLHLSAVEEEEDLTQIIPDDENNRQTGECIVDHPMSSDEEQNNSEFPNLPPVKPSDTYSARQLASMTPAERLALIRKRRGKSAFEKMAKEMMEYSKIHFELMLQHSRPNFMEEMQWKKMCMEERRSNFRELIGVLKDCCSTYKETCAKLESKEIRVVRRVRKKIPEKVQNTEQLQPSLEIASGLLDTTVSQPLQQDQDNPGPSTSLVVSRNWGNFCSSEGGGFGPKCSNI